MFSKCAPTVLCPETLVDVVLCNFFSSLILFLVTLADYTFKFNVSASVHTHVDKIQILGSNILPTLLDELPDEMELTLNIPQLEETHFFHV